MPSRWAPTLAAMVLLVSVVATGGAAADPAWADKSLEDVREVVVELNQLTLDERLSALEEFLIRGAKVNLHVRDTQTRAVARYRFRIDDGFRIRDLGRGTYATPSLRITTTRASIERIRAASDPVSALKTEIQRGRITIQRVFPVGPGGLLLIGVPEAAAGTAGLVFLAVGIGKYGVQGVLGFLWGGVQRAGLILRRGVTTAWQLLKGLVPVLTVLELLDLLDDVKRAIRTRVGTIRAWATGLLRRE